MRLLLFSTLWVHLASSVLLTGAFFMVLLAGAPSASTAHQWDARVLAWSRRLLLVVIGSGTVWLLLRTASFENRPEAAFEPWTVWHAVVDTQPGLVWLARHSLLLILGVFLAMRADVAERCNWVFARGEALLLATVSLVLMSASSHAAAIIPGTARAVAVDATHLLATGIWGGALVPLGLLLRAASPDDGVDARPYAVRAARRFSRAALIAMLLLMASGAMNALVQIESIPALVGTAHGRLLIIKLSLVVPILGLAVVNRKRLLPALSAAGDPRTMRRLALFVGIEALLALVLLAVTVAMTLTTPARHAPPVWPFPFRFSLDILTDVPTVRWRVVLGAQIAIVGLVMLIASFLVARRWRGPLRAGAAALVATGAGVGLLPLIVDAYPTTYRRPPVTYHAESIAAGRAVYGEHCAGCHGVRGSGDGAPTLRPLTGPPSARRHAGELFWLVSHGIPGKDMPGFATRLSEAQRWDVINFIRALGAAEGSKTIGRHVELGRASLVAPDFTIAVGPLSPGALRDYRGRRMVLLVLYTLPGSRGRITELARTYDVLSATGVEIIAVSTHATVDAISELGSSPAVMFPVVTDGAHIVDAYRMIAPGPHAEFLIDRQGYIRAIWREASGAVQAEVHKLNEESEVAPFPDDHVH
jgi:putative copper resistance protein D